MNITRRYHQLHAWLFGYFWLPCPICEEYFGGHEIRDKPTACVVVDGHAWCVCPKESCNSQAISQNIGQWYRPRK